MRFIADDGLTYYGDAILPSGQTDLNYAQQAFAIEGSIFGSHRVTDTPLNIRRLIKPLAPADVGTVRCIGLNYGEHTKEAKMSAPQYPLLFYKPQTALAGPSHDILVPRMAQEGLSIDYECELVVIIGKQYRNVSEADSLDYVLGCAVGNDVTHRDWQMKWG